MVICKIDPIQDPRWQAFVERHPDASIFHTVGWLTALQRTYGFRTVAYSTARAGEDLRDGLVFCDAGSWLTGKRLISLPFSDHCQPLVNSAEALAEVIAHVHAERVQARQNFAEIRALRIDDLPGTTSLMQRSKSYCFHTLDLSPQPEHIFKKFHKDCIQRKIRRAEKENLVYRSGRSLSLLQDFYRLQVLTRRRQGLPPQPFKWFSNLLSSLGDQLTIHTVSNDGLPAAAIMTLKLKNTVTYKYGCSIAGLNRLGGMPFLFWQVIREAKANGANKLDLGRSDLENHGLIDFKDRLGATRSVLLYYRDSYVQTANSQTATVLNHANNVLRKQILPRLPQCFLTMAGKLIYKHVG